MPSCMRVRAREGRSGDGGFSGPSGSRSQGTGRSADFLSKASRSLLQELSPQRAVAARPFAFAVLFRGVLGPPALQLLVQGVEIVDHHGLPKRRVFRRPQFPVAGVGKGELLDLVF